MRRYQKNRQCGDCDSPRSYCSTTAMQLGPVPIDTQDDYGKNGAHFLADGGGSKFRNNNWFNNGSESYWFTKVYKI